MLIRAIQDRTGVDRDAIRILSARQDRLVARVDTANGPFVIKADTAADAFGREVRAMATLRRIDLPVSQVIHVEAGPPSLLVTSWFGGVPISPGHPAAQLARVGEILRTIHEIPADPPFSGHATIRAWIEGWLRSLMPWWIESGNAPAGAEAGCQAWLRDCAPAMADRQGRLILFDGRPDHFLVNHEGTVHMIDVADLMPGDPAMDLAVLDLEAPGILEPVLAGYRPTATERSTQDILVPLFAFLRALSAAEWQERVGNPAHSRRYLVEARTRFDRQMAVTP